MRLSCDDLPMFFAEPHAALGEKLRAAAQAFVELETPGAHSDEAQRDRAAADALAQADLFALVVPHDGKVDTRALCLAREMLGYVSPRADSILAVQGLGTHALGLAGSPDQRAQLKAFSHGAAGRVARHADRGDHEALRGPASAAADRPPGGSAGPPGAARAMVSRSPGQGVRGRTSEPRPACTEIRQARGPRPLGRGEYSGHG